MSLEKRLEAGKEAVLEASKIILDFANTRDLNYEKKKDGSPVTKADKTAEMKIKEILISKFPSDGFIGEESKAIQGVNDYTWYCDPIDGTWCIINGEDTVSTSLALNYKDKTVLGVVYNPITDRLFAGAEGIEITLDGNPIPNLNRKDPQNSVYNFQITAKRKDDILRLYDLWDQKKIAKLVSRGGSVAYNLAQVAEGSHSVYIAATTKPAEIWDIAAGKYLVESVGGIVSLLPDKKTMIAATNPVIYEKTLKLLEEVKFGE